MCYFSAALSAEWIRCKALLCERQRPSPASQWVKRKRAHAECSLCPPSLSCEGILFLKRASSSAMIRVVFKHAQRAIKLFAQHEPRHRVRQR